MPFMIEYQAEEDFIEATFTGQIAMSLVKTYISDLLPIIEATGCNRLLNDSVKAQILLSSGDILQLPKMAAASHFTAHLKQAVLSAPGKSGYSLYEALSKIVGHQLQVFTDRKDALEWLLSKKD